MFINLFKMLLISMLMTVTACKPYTPIVLWHGLGLTCCDPFYAGRIGRLLKQYLTGVHVLSLRIGNSELEDFFNGFTMHPDKQIEIACNIIKSDPLLADGFNAIGHSQGSQLLRGLVQRCPGIKMKTLITMAGQHQGNYGLPVCPASFIPLCDIIRRIYSQVAYSSLLQENFVPSTYWHNPLNEEIYKERSTYIADINNERTINQTYIKNLQSLEKFVMVKFTRDLSIQSVETEWFGFYKPGQCKEVQTLQESDLYISDRLGLKQMDNDGKLHFLEVPWFHVQFEWDWFKENVVDKYLV